MFTAVVPLTCTGGRRALVGNIVVMGISEPEYIQVLHMHLRWQEKPHTVNQYIHR